MHAKDNRKGKQVGGKETSYLVCLLWHEDITKSKTNCRGALYDQLISVASKVNKKKSFKSHY